MSGTLPTVRNGLGSALYPVSRSVEFLTGIKVGVNAKEQRWKRRAPLTRFTLQYTNMLTSEVNAHRTFFNSQKGAFDSTWSMVLGSTTYNNLAFEQDEFSFEERESKLYAFTLKARQVKNPGVATPSASAYPTLANGLRAQRPYVQARRFYTMRNDSPIGPRYAYGFYGFSLTGFPAGALMGWTLSYPALSDADLATLENFFRAMCGMWGEFSFTDPDSGTTYTKCRFGSDAMEIQHLGPNQNSVALTIVETNN